VGDIRNAPTHQDFGRLRRWPDRNFRFPAGEIRHCIRDGDFELNIRMDRAHRRQVAHQDRAKRISRGDPNNTRRS